MESNYNILLKESKAKPKQKNEVVDIFPITILKIYFTHGLQIINKNLGNIWYKYAC